MIRDVIESLGFAQEQTCRGKVVDFADRELMDHLGMTVSPSLALTVLSIISTLSAVHTRKETQHKKNRCSLGGIGHFNRLWPCDM